MTDKRRLYLNNWAILTVENEAKWHFGDIDGDKLLQTVDFVSALSKLGGKIWGQGIGIIRLRYPKPHPTQAREIMAVNLLDKYGILISDPLVTTRLFHRIEMYDDTPWDEMRSILAGSASVIYSDFYSREEEYLPRHVVDVLFQEAISAVTYDKNVTVGNGECSFSALSFEELLFFHALLRNLFESYISMSLPGTPWGVIHANAGVPLHLEYKPPLDAALISAFSSVVVNYCKLLFEAYPARLVFGTKTMDGMDFIATDNNVFIISNPRKLLKLQKFVRLWKRLPLEVIHDLAPSMHQYFVELTTQEQREKLKNLEFHRLINRLTNMGIRRAREYKL
ncbi:MAG: hypothetical protein ACFFDT_02595 [Candidatus Hodarchaeota archaeon]